jgi:quinol monooxygenase YgiN
MSISLIVSGLGAVIAAIGSGVLLARCFRAPRGDLIGWSVALLGLLVGLGAEALGHLVGFDASMFRAMEIGAQVIAPLALILALSEVAARSTPVRFCARLYLPALTVVAVVVLLLDQLTDAAFSKAWPNPATYYQIAPEYVLYAVGTITVLVVIIATVTVARRGSQPGWHAVLRPQLAGAGAALVLAYPSLALLAGNKAGVHLPVSSLFAVLCTVAAGLTWLAGAMTGRLPLAELRGRAAAPGGRGDRYPAFGESGDLQPLAASGQGLYRGGVPYRPDPAGQDMASGMYRTDPAGQPANRGYRDHDEYSGPGVEPEGGWRDGQAARDWDDDWDRNRDLLASGRDWGEDDAPYRSQYTGGDGDYATGDFAPGDFAAGGPGAAEYGRGYPEAGWQAAAAASELAPDRAGPSGSGRRPGGWPDERLDQAGRGDAAERAQLFGQIAIYTLLEDRVDEFDQLAERVVEQVRSGEPDALVFIVHAVPSAPMQRILYEVYRDRVAYQRHVRLPHVMQFETDRRPYVLATNVIELGLQQAKVSPFPSVAELFGEPGYDTSGFERPDYLRDYGDASAPQGGHRDYR